jgi:hypothetical protein
MLSDQQRARVFGVLYLITFVTSIPALFLYQPVLDDPVGYIASAGQDNRIFFGAYLELLLLLGIYYTVKGFRPSAPILRAGNGGYGLQATPAVTPA